MIEPLTASLRGDLARHGGKACGLLRLLAAGFPVPEAWCIPIGAATLPLSAELTRALGELALRLSGVRLAVRSSAASEDLEGGSAAGIYASVLDVTGPDALVVAVTACVDAFHAEPARAYRAARGLPDGPGPALVIQRMLSPRVAGVLFTANPRRPLARELAVEAVHGQGEGLVSGGVEPDHLVLDLDTGAVREARIGAKAVEWVHDAALGRCQRPVEAERRQRLALTPAEVHELWRLGRAIDARLGPRQDLEWAFEGDTLWVLQQRPITGLPPARPRELWTRRFGDEYLADCSTPLSDTLLTKWIRDEMFRAFAELAGERALAASSPLRLYRGRAYLSGRYLTGMLSWLPRRVRVRASQGWVPPEWQPELQAPAWRLRALLGILSVPARDPRMRLAGNLEALAGHARTIRRALAPRLAQDYQALSLAEWQAQLAEMDAIGREHFRIIRWGMGVYNPALHAALRALLERWADDDGSLYRALVSGLPGALTAEINRDLWRLGELARRAPGGLPRGLALADARLAFRCPAFWAAFDGFLARHGHRAPGRDLRLPRWCETPALVLALVAPGEPPPPDPALAEARAVEGRRQAERELRARVGPGPLGAARAALLRWLCQHAQAFTVYRENQRYHLDLVLLHARNLAREAGRRLTERGVLGCVDDVFFLEADELERLLGEPRPSPALTAVIAQRRADFSAWLGRMPASYLFDDAEVEAEAEASPGVPSPPGALRGLGVSAGRARGPARIVRALDDLAAVAPGDILVARTIDPVWTAVFPRLAGLVTETGGFLSHGAILAREYHLAAVSALAGATTLIATGDQLTLDGHLGTVHRGGPA